MRQFLWLRIVISVAFFVIAGLHLLRPELKIDNTTAILVIVCTLPWVQPPVKTVELLGVKLERQELKGKVAEARGAAADASRQAGLARAGSESPVPTALASPGAAEQQIAILAREYERIRKTKLPGASRTKAMTVVVRQMIDASRKVPPATLHPLLVSKNQTVWPILGAASHR